MRRVGSGCRVSGRPVGLLRAGTARFRRSTHGRLDETLQNWSEAGWVLEHVTEALIPNTVGGGMSPETCYTLFWAKND